MVCVTAYGVTLESLGASGSEFLGSSAEDRRPVLSHECIVTETHFKRRFSCKFNLVVSSFSKLLKTSQLEEVKVLKAKVDPSPSGCVQLTQQ